MPHSRSPRTLVSLTGSPNSQVNLTVRQATGNPFPVDRRTILRHPTMREKLVRRFLILTAAVTVTATLFAACGDDGGGDTSSDDTTTDAPVVDDDTGDNTGTRAKRARHGLRRSRPGRTRRLRRYTLYIFEQDDGTTSNCNDACSTSWPALTAEAEPAAGEGVDGALLSTAEQADGACQVTYNGHLLYTYSGDAAPGETNGTSIRACGSRSTPPATRQLIRPAYPPGRCDTRPVGRAPRGSRRQR